MERNNGEAFTWQRLPVYLKKWYQPDIKRINIRYEVKYFIIFFIEKTFLRSHSIYYWVYFL